MIFQTYSYRAYCLAGITWRVFGFLNRRLLRSLQPLLQYPSIFPSKRWKVYSMIEVVSFDQQLPIGFEFLYPVSLSLFSS